MFSKSSDHEITKISPSGDATTLIANGTSIKGDLNFHGSLEIQGSIAGTITAEDENAQVRVIQGGAVEGKIAVPTVIVNGHVRGDIFATKHALLASKQLSREIYIIIPSRLNAERMLWATWYMKYPQRMSVHSSKMKAPIATKTLAVDAKSLYISRDSQPMNLLG